MKYFFDTEFNDNGKTIELISIGIVSEDGREMYAESSEFNPEECDEWVKLNVLTQLTGEAYTKDQIRNWIMDFTRHDESPEFWAYFGAYDWVVFCQLFGKMIDLPQKFPQWVREIKQLEEYKSPMMRIKQNSMAHNALNDARHVRRMYEFLTGKIRL